MNKQKIIILRIVTICVALACVMSLKTQSFAWWEAGSYPTRKGTILVTSDKYKGLIPTGHAAIVYNGSYVIESVQKGVVVGNNNWRNRKNSVYGVTVRGTSFTQDRYAADWCRRQVGKAYNFNYFNIGTRSRFYCSQLVWAAFKDMYGINLNTNAFGTAVHPMELVNSPRTYTVYRFQR